MPIPPFITCLVVCWDLHSHLACNRRVDGSYFQDCYGPGMAGGIAIIYRGTSGPIRHNSHVLTGLTLTSCTGGVQVESLGAQYGGAGGIAILYYSAAGNKMSSNSHVMFGLTLTSCSGWTGVQFGTGAGGVAISYYSSRIGFTAGSSAIKIYNNTHTLSNIYASHCRGGD